MPMFATTANFMWLSLWAFGALVPHDSVSYGMCQNLEEGMYPIHRTMLIGTTTGKWRQIAESRNEK
jgi:hypothetical protein